MQQTWVFRRLLPRCAGSRRTEPCERCQTRRGPTRDTPKNEGGTEHNVDERLWINIGLTLTRDGKFGKEEYFDSNEESTILTFQFNQLHDSLRRSIEDRRYMDTGILLDTWATCSIFKREKMLLNRVSEHTLRAYKNGGYQTPRWWDISLDSSECGKIGTR